MNSCTYENPYFLCKHKLVNVHAMYSAYVSYMTQIS